MNEKLEIWKERFIEAEQEYSARLASFDAWTKQYKGDKEIVTDGRRGKNAAIYRKKTERSEQFLRLAMCGSFEGTNYRTAYKNRIILFARLFACEKRRKLREAEKRASPLLSKRPVCFS